MKCIPTVFLVILEESTPGFTQIIITFLIPVCMYVCMYLFKNSKWEWSIWGILENSHLLQTIFVLFLLLFYFMELFFQDEHKGPVNHGMVVQLARCEILGLGVFTVNREKCSLWHMVPLTSLNFFSIRGMRLVFLQIPLNAGTTSSLIHVSVMG